MRNPSDWRVSAALNIYAQQPAAFDEASRSAATRIGTYAVVAAGNLHAYHDAARTRPLGAGVQTRMLIDQASGILAERFFRGGQRRRRQLLAQRARCGQRQGGGVAEHFVTIKERLQHLVLNASQIVGGGSHYVNRGPAEANGLPGAAALVLPPEPRAGRRFVGVTATS